MSLTKKINSSFANDVLHGLRADEKFLSSMYFYDKKGSEIFRQIMRMPTYYLTDSEYEIFQNFSNEILNDFRTGGEPFTLIELGAGDGYKTKVLLRNFLNNSVDFKYSPIDISPQAVTDLVDDLEQSFPDLNVEGLTGDYFKLLTDLKLTGQRKIMLFLGSNIGNFNRSQSLDFLKRLHEISNRGDLLMIGFDLKKDKQIIMDAYDDPRGITASFNLNLLNRINRELNANFDLDNFRHLETYDELSGTAESFLVSTKEQSVYIEKLDLNVDFAPGEKIYTEMSQKYDIQMIETLAKESGFEIVRNYTDSRQYFMNSVWKLKS